MIHWRCRTIRDDRQVIERTHHSKGLSSQVGVKIPLRTSNADEFDYLPDEVIEENRRALEKLERRKLQDKKDLRAAYRQVSKERKFPLSSQADAMKLIEKGKNEERAWCFEKINFRKYKSRIVDASISGERATKRRPVRIELTTPPLNMFILPWTHLGTMNGWRSGKRLSRRRQHIRSM